MTCHVCSRSPSSQLSFCCSTCARNQLYQLRVKHARILLEREIAGQQIETAVVGKEANVDVLVKCGASDKPGQGENNSTCWTIQAAQSRGAQSGVRAHAILRHIEILEREIRDGKDEITRRRAVIAQRRSDAESANYQLAERRAAALASVQNSINKAEDLWNSLHNKTAESRIFLCREAASLYGLRQRTRRKQGEVMNSYTIGGLGIVDLREMNSASPAQISTSLSNIAHLLVLVSHYLSLRLPAEVTLPHRGYPSPTVFAPAASYLSRDATFPGISPPHSSSTSPTTSRMLDTKSLPRPRPLFIDKNLPKLSKEDPATYALFLEGVVLLAWNIAWVCRTQGLSTGSESWEDICQIGQNLWQLLVAPLAQSSASMRVLPGWEVMEKLPTSKESPRLAIHRIKSFPMLGHYSHGTAHSFLGASEGTEFMRSWKLPSPVKVVDKLKSVLLGEMASAEWELLEEKEWDDLGLQAEEEQPVLVAAKRSAAANLVDDTISMASTRAEGEDPLAGDSYRGEDHVGSSRPKGTSGWTKVKSR